MLGLGLGQTHLGLGLAQTQMGLALAQSKMWRGALWSFSQARETSWVFAEPPQSGALLWSFVEPPPQRSTRHTHI